MYNLCLINFLHFHVTLPRLRPFLCPFFFDPTITLFRHLIIMENRQSRVGLPINTTHKPLPWNWSLQSPSDLTTVTTLSNFAYKWQEKFEVDFAISSALTGLIYYFNVCMCILVGLYMHYSVLICLIMFLTQLSSVYYPLSLYIVALLFNSSIFYPLCLILT